MFVQVVEGRVSGNPVQPCRELVFRVVCADLAESLLEALCFLCLTLPVPVREYLFAADFFVFILGISLTSYFAAFGDIVIDIIFPSILAGLSMLYAEVSRFSTSFRTSNPNSV